MINKLIIFCLALFHLLKADGQDIAAEHIDSTISIFWDATLKINIRIFETADPDPERYNAVLTVYKLAVGNRKVIFRDSLFCYPLQIKTEDMNGDGMNDLLIYNMSNGPENPSFHLFLVNQKLGSLKKVKKFEKVYSPKFDPKKCLIHGFESYEKKIVLRYYVINKDGVLCLTEE
jgi:hypothetical protein